MTTNMAWLAAILKPHDVAFHANFASEEEVDSPGTIALLALGEFLQFSRLVHPDPFMPKGELPPWTAPTQVEQDIIAYTQSAISIGKIQEGAEGLRDLCLAGEIVDMAALTMAASIACLAFAESDDYASSVSTIDAALSQLTVESDDARLCKAILLLQRGLRISDSGQGDGLADAREAHELLRRIRPDNISSFKLSLGVGWDSERTVIDICEYLLDGCQEALTLSPMQAPPTPDFDYYSWQDRVRSRPSHISLLNERRLTTGYERFVASAYKDQTRGTTSREMVFGTIDRGETHLFAGQFADEVSGRRSARESRRHLAEYRFLATRGTSAESAEVAEILRLLRHSGSLDSLKAALRVIQAEGPLLALRADAEAVCRGRLQASTLREPELFVLHAAADLLSEEAAREALSAVLTAVQAGVPAIVAGRWSSLGTRLEPGWLAAAALSVAGDQTDRFAAQLLEFLESEAQDDEILDRALARAMREVDWDSVDDSIRARFDAWATDGGEGHPGVREQAISSLNSGAPVVSDPTKLSLGDVAQGLNIAINGGEFPQDWLPQAIELVRGDLREIAQRAAMSTFAGGGVSTADVAVGLAVYVGVVELWPDIAQFLANPLVQRADTAAAFDRLARESAQVPADVVGTIAHQRDGILYATDDVFGSSVDPYPAGLRFFASLQVVGADELLVMCSQLAGSGGPTGRHEAARVVTLACRASDPPTWLRVAALRDSWDPLPEVRSEAAGALVGIANTDVEGREIFEERVLSLLSEDGLLVPIRSLRGLIELDVPLSNRIREAVGVMAETNPSRILRVLATELISKSQQQ